ncbi:hypothetical protein DUR87_04300 [Salmonella enterica subsp. enterica serovar Virchow]|uniref:Uncharacterized protein n=1 Tax=Salmonella virchow TaxID=48409 RepID=A0A5V8E950_SALVI|nr:hypothetical protein [Salmonella enterica subsp. enterica serovar Virchow]EAX0550916.1 hypothetical protein [Salmonella enterica]HBM1420979.1 hypothetical protein [Salmonella enterica subsp. enterica]EAB8328468.1 hypothetical protein [Salmonella enterica subsp. enterica serovar Virchow]EAB9418860.1 hypothetical protein [Salmonella enterica subsp. enterica serovar Virchow]
MLIRLNWSEKKEQTVDSAESSPSFKVYKIYNKSHKCDSHHVFMIFYYSFMI